LEIIFNDLKLVKQIPHTIITLFLIILGNAAVFLHAYSLFRRHIGFDKWLELVSNEPKPATILSGIILSLSILFAYLKRLNKFITIKYDDISNEILIINIYQKEQRIKLQDIGKVKLYTITNNIDDEPLLYNEEINLYDKNDNIILSYKSRKLRIIIDYICSKNNEIKIEYGNIKEKDSRIV
jgi:hypothetical protein